MLEIDEQELRWLDKVAILIYMAASENTDRMAPNEFPELVAQSIYPLEESVRPFPDSPMVLINSAGGKIRPGVIEWERVCHLLEDRLGYTWGEAWARLSEEERIRLVSPCEDGDDLP